MNWVNICLLNKNGIVCEGRDVWDCSGICSEAET